jgi:hypothetical protein
VTTDQAPDTFINQDVYAGRAVREVKRRDPSWATRAGEDEQRLNTAADALTAAYSLRAIPNLTGEDQGTAGGYRREAVDVDARISELLTFAADEVAQVAGSDADAMPTFFTAAPGGRGR